MKKMYLESHCFKVKSVQVDFSETEFAMVDAEVYVNEKDTSFDHAFGVEKQSALDWDHAEVHLDKWLFVVEPDMPGGVPMFPLTPKQHNQAVAACIAEAERKNPYA